MKKNILKSFAKLFLMVVFVAVAWFAYVPKNATSNEVFAAQPTSSSQYAGMQLKNQQKKLYDFLVVKLKQVANGELVSTKFVIDENMLVEFGAKKEWTSAELGKDSIVLNDVSGLFFEQFNASLVVDALLHDLPFDMFWFDKTTGYSNSISASTTGTKITITSLTMTMQVTNDYKAVGYVSTNPQVNTTKIMQEASALNNAKAIVEEYSTLSDYQKLLAYKNRICEMVSYNDEAASPLYSGGYGNPWQAVYVFDNISSTNVVCEGYAKAFQLLCNLSTFESSLVKCYTVSGVMSGGTGAGGHMWNVVVMDDEFSYLVDVTNSDTGSVGQSGGLFLVGTNNGNINLGYSFELSSTISFDYDVECLGLWGNDSESILNLATSNYDEEHPVIVLESNFTTYDKQQVSVGLDSVYFDFCYKFDGEVDESLYNWEHEWFEDNNETIGSQLNTAPIDAGFYWLKITATHKANSAYKVISTKRVQVMPKLLEIASATATNREYDETDIVAISNIQLLGVCSGDEVFVESALAKISNKNVGTYNVVDISNVVLGGAQKNNYYVVFLANDVALSTGVEITKTLPTCTENFVKVSEEGKTIADIQMQIVAKGPAGENLTGTFVWLNAENNELDSTTVIVKDARYKYKFIPDNSNYSSYFGEVVLWSDAQTEPTPTNFFSLENLPTIIYSAIGVITAILVIVIIVKTKQSKKA